VVPVSVRNAEPSDLGALLGLYRELAGERDSAQPSDAAISAPVLAQIIAERDRQLLVAETDRTVLGTADLLIVANLTHRATPWAIVENVVVAGAARRQGVGRQLMTHAVELARQGGCYKLQLLSRKERAGAHAFYRSLGFDAAAEGFRLYFE
jgi:ribosomal protein S18 acetylase RimI-like enzyme